MQKGKQKPKCERLSKKIQVPLRETEYNILNQIRSESSFTTIAAYVRALILKELRGKNQTVLL